MLEIPLSLGLWLLTVCPGGGLSERSLEECCSAPEIGRFETELMGSIHDFSDRLPALVSSRAVELLLWQKGEAKGKNSKKPETVNPGGEKAAGEAKQGPANAVKSLQAKAAKDPKPQGTDLEAYRKNLLKTGIEANTKREQAVQGLLLLKEPQAHLLLQKMLLRGDDPDGLSRYILNALTEKWPQAKDPTFGREFPVRKRLISGYVQTFAAYFSTDERVRPAKVTATIKDLALVCMRAGGLSAGERKAIFTKLLADPNLGLAQGGMLAAAQCQDLGLAPVLAKHLSGPNATTAREALRSLTFAETRFASEAEFEAWWAVHRKSYRELAFEAAARGVAAIDELRLKAEAEYSKQSIKLISALLGAAKVEWSSIQAEVLGGQPESSRPAYLDTVLDVLQERPSIEGIAQERLAFAEALQAQYLVEGLDAVHRARLLETLAYLVPADATELRGKVSSLLIGALIAPRHNDPELGYDAMRLGALRGLRSYPSDQHLDRMVKIGMESIAGKHIEELEAVLICLRSDHWHAPTKSSARTAWLDFIAAVFAEPDAVVRVELKQSAGGVAVAADATGKVVPEAFDKLLAVVKQTEQAPILRRQLINRLRAFQGKELQQRYTDEVSKLLLDPSAEIRIEAATQLKNFPKSSDAATNTARTLHVARQVADRFPLETDDRVLNAFVDCLQRMAADIEVAPVIVGRLDRITKAVLTDAKADDPRRKHLVKLLRNIASASSLSEIHWVRAGEMLVTLAERNDLRIVLGRQQAVSKRPSYKPEFAERAMRLVVEAALMLPATKLWSGAGQKDEASDVLTALAALRSLSKPFDTSAVRALHIAVLAGLRRDDEMLPFARKYLDAEDLTLSPSERAAVALDLAEGLFRKGELKAAAKALVDRSGQSPWTARALDAADATAKGLLQKGDKTEALPLLQALAAKTPADAPSFPDRVLLFAEARLDLDPKGAKATVHGELEAKKTLFEGSALAPALKARWAALQSRVKEG